MMRNLDELKQMISMAFEKEGWVKQPEELYEPIAYTLGLGGKRVRPLLLVASCELFGGKAEIAIDAAIGLEVFHNFTLVHDDIMDQSPFRRGSETVYRKWNTNTAILSGDVMLCMAYSYFQRYSVNYLPQLLKLFTTTAIEVCEGQQMDMNLEKMTSVSISTYLEMIRLKTAVLLAAALKMGAIVAGASVQDQNIIYNFGIEMGLAFQLRDDWLDCYGQVETFGKPIGLDILDHKKTFLYLTAVEKASASEKEELRALYEESAYSDEEKIVKVLALFDQLQVCEQSLKQIELHHQKGVDLLSSLNVASERKMNLEILCASLLGRMS